MRDESDRVRNERRRLQVEVVNHQIDILALELDPRNGNLLDQTDDAGHHDIDKVPVETVAVSLQAVEANLAGIRHVFAHGLDCVDQSDVSWSWVSALKKDSSSFCKAEASAFQLGLSRRRDWPSSYREEAFR